MNRRKFLKTVAVTMAASSKSVYEYKPVRMSKNRIETNRPNIIYMLTDDQRWDGMSCMGHPILKTPNMDRLAAEGTLFEQAFVTTAICMASRASIMTGLFERKHECNFHSGDLHPLFFEKSYPVLVRSAGYHTGFIGKFGFVVSEEKRKHAWNKLESFEKSNFDMWYGFSGQGEYFPQGQSGKHLTQIMAEQACDFISSCPQEKPFCLSISFKAPHAPFTPDPAYENLYRNDRIPVPAASDHKYFNRLPKSVQKSSAEGAVHDFWKQWFGTPELYQKTMKNYYRLLTGVDAALEQIREHLKRLGIEDNTVIILHSDIVKKRKMKKQKEKKLKALP